MIILLQGSFVLAGALLSIVYLLRLNEMRFGVHRTTYVLYHSCMGIGCASVAVDMLAGGRPSMATGFFLLGAICHVAITHRSGKTFSPPDYMRRRGGQHRHT